MHIKQFLLYYKLFSRGVGTNRTNISPMACFVIRAYLINYINPFLTTACLSECSQSAKEEILRIIVKETCNISVGTPGRNLSIAMVHMNYEFYWD